MTSFVIAICNDI